MSKYGIKFIKYINRRESGITDREKVLTGLECLLTNEISCPDCPYDTAGYCVTAIAKDALALLKEQEEQIEHLEHDLAVAQSNLNYYVNGND